MSTNPVLLHPSSSNLHCPVCGGSPQISSSTLTPSFVPADPLLKFNGRTQHESFQAKKKKSNNGLYLSIILGNNIDLTLGSSDRLLFFYRILLDSSHQFNRCCLRFLYKKDYEKFKLRVTLINLLLLIATGVFPSRPLDTICIFMQVWYYCTLTIRESILMINGSSIHWWWVAHHYLACILAGVSVTWPEDSNYLEFRSQFGLFAVYMCFVQQLQYQYQSGCLRRLRALGSGSDMDVTLEGFAGWMFEGLTFLLPFLAVAYAFELYNSYFLYKIWFTRNCVWQVAVLGILFLIVGVGNIIMVVGIVWQKIREDPMKRKLSLRAKYTSFPQIYDKKTEPYKKPNEKLL